MLYLCSEKRVKQYLAIISKPCAVYQVSISLEDDLDSFHNDVQQPETSYNEYATSLLGHFSFMVTLYSLRPRGLGDKNTTISDPLPPQICKHVEHLYTNKMYKVMFLQLWLSIIK